MSDEQGKWQNGSWTVDTEMAVTGIEMGEAMIEESTGTHPSVRRSMIRASKAYHLLTSKGPTVIADSDGCCENGVRNPAQRCWYTKDGVFLSKIFSSDPCRGEPYDGMNS